MNYYIDSMKLQNSTFTVLGWAAGSGPEVPVELEIRNKKGEAVTFTRTDSERYDANKDLFQGKSKLQLGFCISFPYEEGETYYLVLRADGKEIRERLKPGADQKNLAQKVISVWKQYGWKTVWKRVKRKLGGSGRAYQEWRLKVIPSETELEAQRKKTFPVMPKFSVIVPLYRTPEKYLREMIESVQAQTYGNWELCLADGSGDAEAQKQVEQVVSEYQKKDPRVRYKALSENFGIAGNTNEALSMAEGEYLVLLDHDDTLAAQALFACAERINKETEAGRSAEVLYSDEDKVCERRGKEFYFDPHFKPDFNPDLLRSVNYISHLSVIKKSLVDRVGMFRKEFDGSQDYDFMFRCTEQATGICHIPQVLYHWRVNEGSTAEDPAKKLYAFEAGAKAIKAHCERVGIGEVEVLQNEVLGTYRLKYPVKGEPLVSVIIPNKDHTDDLRVCVRSLFEKASYKNMEVLVVENNSTEPETFECYKELEQQYEALHVLYWKGRGFNFSAVNNFAVPSARGEYLLFLNNDTELINEDCIEELLSYCQRADVGIVGAQLFYGDDTIQHAGVIVGYGGIAGHAFVGYHKGEKTYFLRSMCAQDYSAVTAACMMTKKSVFEAAGGFDEKLAVAFNDVDYCLKVRELGKLVVYDPFAQLHHYESKSRGVEDTPEKILRFDGEVSRFRRRWAKVLEAGDPFYNPNLTLLHSDFSLKDLEKES